MKAKTIKNVDRVQCAWIIINSLVALCILFLPATFGTPGITPAINVLPIIGNGSISLAQEFAALSFSSLFGISADILFMLLSYGLIAYFGILLFNILFSLILIFSGSQILRKICKVISIFAGFIMLANTFACIIHIVGIFGYIFSTPSALQNIMSYIESSAILFVLGMLVFSFRHTIKQFKWFSRLY
jgi:hypothetical protein